jgi:hypothetical protein
MPNLPAINNNVMAEEASIEMCIVQWRQEYDRITTPEASQNLFADEILHQLQAGTMDATAVVDLANNGHPFAAIALRRIIDGAMEASCFETALPMSIREYARRRLRGESAPTRHPSTAKQVVNHFKRDVLVIRLIDTVCRRWPAVPRLHSTSRRRSAANLVGKCLGLSETSARRIYQNGSRGRLGNAFLGLLGAPRKTSPTI